MSYDFRLCLPAAGRSAEEIARGESDASRSAPLTPEQTERMRRIADALSRAFPALRDPQAGPPAIPARGERFDGLELNADDGHNVQVSLFPDEAAVSVPFGHGDAEAENAFAQIWKYLEIMQREGGYFTYDPQLGRVVEGRADQRASLECYLRAQQRIAQKPGTRFVLAPASLTRGQYAWRWLALTGAAVLLSYLTMRAVMRTPAEPLMLVWFVAWFVAKMTLLDPARLRNIGWSPRLTFLSLFPPAAAILQLFLFLLK